MADPDGETRQPLASGASATDAGECCEALNVIAAGAIIRSFSTLQDNLKRWRSNTRDGSLACSAQDREGDSESFYGEPQGEESPVYKSLRDLSPCAPFTISFSDICCKLQAAQMACPLVQRGEKGYC